MNSNAVNNAWAKEAELLARRLALRLNGLGPVTGTALVDRLVQRVLDIGRLPYARLALADRLSPGAVVDLGRCSLETGAGRLLVNTRQWMLGVAEYMIHWIYCLYALLVVRIGAGQPQGVVLVFGVGTDVIFQDGRDSVFATYCRSCPIVPLREGRHLYIQTTEKTAVSSDHRITYVRRPLIELVRRSKLGWLVRMKAAVFHVHGLIAFFGAAFRAPELALLGRDCAYLALAAVGNAGNLVESVVTTCTSITEQPLWGRCLSHAKVHMVWYAQNWKPVVFAADGVESDIPFLNWIRVDEHWVWTNKFAHYLRRLTGTTEIHAVGPVVWQIPGSVKPDLHLLQIVVFDVSPYSNETALSYCESPNYNHPDKLRKFMEDIVSLRSVWESATGRTVMLRVKTKRGYHSAYDSGYFQFLEKLNFKGEIKLEHHASNIYDMISATHVVIAYPFTSPPYLADAIEVPSVYYDPTGKILHHDFSDRPASIAFASNKDQLQEQVLKLLSMETGQRCFQKESENL